MGVRLLILVALAGGLAVYFAFAKKPAPAAEPEQDTLIMTASGGVGETETVREIQKLVTEQDIGGEEPEVEPEFDLKVEVDTSSGKNRLYFTISEKHGYYVDEFQLVAYWVEEGVTGPEDSPLSVPIHLNLYKKANETLRTCVEIVPAELANIGGDIGTTKDWEVMLAAYGRAREENPDKFPVISEVGQCH
jgi:hypothetical protein